MTCTRTVRARGPSSSATRTRCHWPRTTLPPLTWSERLWPSSIARRCASALKRSQSECSGSLCFQSASRSTICSSSRLMSAWSACCDSFMKTESVVCIDHRLTMPSRTPDPVTIAPILSVTSISSMRSSVWTTRVSACTTQLPVADEPVAAVGESGTLTVELLVIDLPFDFAASAVHCRAAPALSAGAQHLQTLHLTANGGGGQKEKVPGVRQIGTRDAGLGTRRRRSFRLQAEVGQGAKGAIV